MLKIKNLDFYYRKGEKLFNNLNLELKNGNIYGLLGKNGAGKTTLLKLISGLLFPKSGECKYGDYNAKDRDPRFLNQLYFVADTFYLSDLKIKQYLELYAPFYDKFSMEQFYTNLNEFEVKENDNLKSLSYGQKKKFIISFAIAANPSLLLLDEPTNGLDIPSKTTFRKIITRAASEERIIVISTHQVRDMKNIIDPIIILDKGQIILNMETAQLEEKVELKLLPQEPQKGEVLYYENTLGGYAALVESTGSGSGELDIELLFNALTSEKDLADKLTNKEG